MGPTYALTGVPGTGKTSVARELGELFHVVEANQLARDVGAIVDRDEARGADIVDEDLLAERTREALPNGAVVIEGGLAHFCDPDVVVVLRCHPRVLRERLAGREWSQAKVDENVLAETLDAVTSEVQTPEGAAWEIDTTELTPEEVATLSVALFKGQAVTHPCVHPLGGVDWSELLLEGDPP